MLDVLVTAVMRLSHAALGAMAERGSGGIINVSSVAAFLPRGTYSAAKAWVNSFSRVGGLRVPRPRRHRDCLCPGFTKTEFHERMDVSRGSAPDFMWLDADELVATALKDHAKGKVVLDPRARSTRRSRPRARVIPERESCCQRFQSLGAEVASSISRSYSSARSCCSRGRGRPCRCRGSRSSR